MSVPADAELDEVVALFLSGRLDAARWDHAAHLHVAHHLLAAEGSPAAALARMRLLIEAHNARVGLRPGSRGFHETITRYFMGSVHVAAVPVEDLLAVPELATDAPLRHWSPTALGSPEARAGWMPPDRAPLPWVWPPG